MSNSDDLNLLRSTKLFGDMDEKSESIIHSALEIYSSPLSMMVFQQRRNRQTTYLAYVADERFEKVMWVLIYSLLRFLKSSSEGQIEMIKNALNYYRNRSTRFNIGGRRGESH
jgi:hypothetical protein